MGAGGPSKAPLSGVAADFGGHSRFSLISSLAESPVMFDTTLELLEAELELVAERECRLFCCSKRPMRLATLARGRSSGNGLICNRYADISSVWYQNNEEFDRHFRLEKNERLGLKKLGLELKQMKENEETTWL